MNLTGNSRITFRWSDQGGTDRRLRCTRHHKVILSKVDAQSIVKKTRGMNAYKCKSADFWHVGHERKELRRRSG